MWLNESLVWCGILCHRLCLTHRHALLPAVTTRHIHCGIICHITSQPTPCGILCHRLCLTHRVWHNMPPYDVTSQPTPCGIECHMNTADIVDWLDKHHSLLLQAQKWLSLSVFLHDHYLSFTMASSMRKNFHLAEDNLNIWINEYQGKIRVHFRQPVSEDEG